MAKNKAGAKAQKKIAPISPFALSSSPAKPAAKPVAKPGRPSGNLSSSYAPPIDTTGHSSQQEILALNSLFSAHTGVDLSTHPDPAVALASSGLIHAPTSSRGRAVGDLSKQKRPVYSSAADALDAIHPFDFRQLLVSADAVKGINKGVQFVDKNVTKPFESALGNATIGTPAGKKVVSAADWALKNTVAPFADAAGNAIVDTPAAHEIAAYANTHSLNPLNLPVPTYKNNVPVGFGDQTVGQGIGSFATALSNLPYGPHNRILNPLTSSEQAKVHKLGGSYGELGPFAAYTIPGETMAQAASGVNPVTGGLDVASAGAKLTYNQLVSREKNAVKQEKLKAVLDSGKAHDSASDIQTLQDNVKLGPLDKWQRKTLATQAGKNGWDIANPRQYTDADLVRRAFTMVTPASEITTSILRQTGQLASLPAAGAAVVSAAINFVKTGDPQQMENLVKAVSAPYKYLYNDIGKRGFGPALSSFAQERPLDAMDIANGVIRGAGRAFGSGLRAGGSEFAAANRPVNVRVGGLAVESPAGSRVVPTRPYTIGYTNKNMIDTLLLEARAKLISRGIESNVPVISWAAERSAAKRAQQVVRSIATGRDAVSATAAKVLADTAKGLSYWQKQHLAAELIRSQIDLSGNPTSVADIAAWMRDMSASKLAEAAAARTPSGRRAIIAEATRFSNGAKYFDRIIAAPLPEGVLDAARAAVAPLAKKNDAVAAIISEQLFQPDSASLERVTKFTDLATGTKRALTNADIVPGDIIDIGKVGERVPVQVTGVNKLPDGTVQLEHTALMNPNDKQVSVLDAVGKAVYLRPSINKAKYVRDFIMWKNQLETAAKIVQADRNEMLRAEARATNAPEIALSAVDSRRVKMADDIQYAVDNMNQARADGRLSGVRYYTKMYHRRVRKLTLFLRKEEKLARATGRTELADQMRTYRESIASDRRKYGDGITTLDAQAMLQNRVIRSVRAGDTSPAVVRNIEQPGAVSLVEGATIMDQQAARLRDLEQQLIAEKNAAPNASAARSAEKKVADVRLQIDSLLQQASASRGVRPGLNSALDNVQSRFDAMRGAEQFIGASKARLSFKGASQKVLPSVLRILGDIRNKVDQGLPITAADVKALAFAESKIVELEQKVTGYKSYAPDVVLPNTGKETIGTVVGDSAHVGLQDAAVARGEYASVLDQRVAENAAAPTRVSISSVRKMRKSAEKAASNMRRDAAKIIERGQPIVAQSSMQAAFDATSNSIAIKLNFVKPELFKIEAIRNELKDAFIARGEMSGTDATLWLGTRNSSFSFGGQARARAKGTISLAPGEGLDANRFKPLTGTTFASGRENFNNIWNNLVNDTGSLSGHVAWTNEIRTFVEAVSVKVENLTESEAAFLNGDRLALSESESVIWHARDYVAMNPYDKTVRIPDTVNVGTGADATMSDLFMQEATVQDVVRAGGTYLLMPRFLHKAIAAELSSIEYRPTSVGLGIAENITKRWRTFTLNIFPRTAFANLVGSVALAALAGAGPRSFYLAYRHLHYGDVVGPTHLRQGFALNLTQDVSFSGLRSRLPGKGIGGVSLDTPFAGMAWWMNTMRQFNGITEDFGRLAVWYSKAYPEASRLAGESFVKTWTNGRVLSEEAQKTLEMLALGHPDVAAQSARFTELSFRFLGDLHAGGQVNAILRIAIPFQQWYRHILRLTFITMPLKYPGRDLFLHQMGDLGHEYLLEHGILSPFMADVLPILAEESQLPEGMQQFILAAHAGAANPFGTPGQISTGDTQNFASFGASILSPMLRGTTEMIASGIHGFGAFGGNNGNGVVKLGGPDFVTFPKDQNNNYIQLLSADGGAYFLNAIQQMLPLSSFAITSSGQAANSNLLFGNQQKIIQSSGGPLSEKQSADIYNVPGRDLSQLVTDFSFLNAATLLGRMVFGGSLTRAYGRGPVEDKQFAATAKAYQRSWRTIMANIAKNAQNVADENNTSLNSGVVPTVTTTTTQPAQPVAPVAPTAPQGAVNPFSLSG